MTQRMDTSTNRLDDAARAGWLYYVAGNTQEEIAAKLGISRQSAQRLVSLSVSEGLIKVRLDHPIGRCMDLASRLKSRFGLDLAEIVPSDPASAGSGAPTPSSWPSAPAAPSRPPWNS
jgi:DNA-binding transcriptional regulator LsrR (DeoR family)